MSDCIEWQGYRNEAGYGRRKIRGKKFYAHRLAWSEVNGEIPEGMVIRHKCDNPPCVNPEHPELGTYSDNVQDMLLRGRANPARGERAGMAKLSNEQAEAIREIYAEGGRTQASIAREFGVSQPLISMIVRHQTRGVCN